MLSCLREQSLVSVRVIPTSDLHANDRVVAFLGSELHPVAQGTGYQHGGLRGCFRGARGLTGKD